MSSINEQIIKMLDGSQAHATFEHAVENFPADLRGTVPPSLPYSAWQIVEHIRITQHDILTFSDNADGSYKPLNWPADYWPKEPTPPTSTAWDESIATILRERAAFEALVRNADESQLTRPFAWGDGQTLFREALLIIDHAGYHTGELVILRRLLAIWKAK